MSDALDAFIARCRRAAAELRDDADIVTTLAPAMEALLKGPRDFLRPEHFEGDPAHYARNAVYVCPEGGVSLFTMVWQPGQWTPVHDHGTWGVVGVLEGVLEERNFLRMDDSQADTGIRLRRGSVVMLGEGSVSTFVPNPDHIHRTGVPETRRRAVTLHLYGREMSDYHCYNVEAGTREKITVAYRGVPAG
jgi:3-mercaptopropionate dioxygenase